MHKNTKAWRVEKGTRGKVPVDRGGFCTVDIEESGIAISPSPEDKVAVVITDEELRELGYFYAGKGSVMGVKDEGNEEVECEYFVEKTSDHFCGGECAGNGWYRCRECVEYMEDEDGDV